MARSMALVVIALASFGQVAEASAASTALAAIREAYTTNAICSKNNCVNPVFPGMEDLHRLQQAKWITSTLQKTAPSMGFCKNAVSYDPALPVPNGGGADLKTLVQRQDNAASTMFYYHVTALGLEAWDYQKPEHSDDCIKAIWRMTCFTYFPRAEVGTQDGAFSAYTRPCQSSCQNYVRMCKVECCDESVQCVFSHTKAISATQTVTTEGYSPHDGPSSMCTGAASRSAAPLALVFALFAFFSLDMPFFSGGLSGRKLLFVGAIAMIALSLQGCDYDIPIHRIANWRAEPDYLVTHEYIPPGGAVAASPMTNINSCSYQGLSPALQCSGRGQCKPWAGLENSLAFCECDTHWADPECRTKRKSQTIAYLLSIFTGFLGADQFYLGFMGAGVGKLLTFGGFGIWWIYDIIRIGSAPVHAAGTYRVANDLSHFAYVLTCVFVACFVGFYLAHWLTSRFRAKKRRDAMTMSSDWEASEKTPAKPFADAYVSGQFGIQKKPIIDHLHPPDIEAIATNPGVYGSTGQMQPFMGGAPMGGGPNF